MVATYLNDTFTEASDTALGSHTPDTGSGWVKHPNFATAGATVKAATGNVTGDSTSTAIYYNSTSPTTDDYEISADVQQSATTGLPGVMVRVSTTASTWYQFFLTSSGVSLEKSVAGTTTNLKTVNFTVANNTTYRLTLRVRGNQLDGFVDGNLVASKQDTSITTGQAGIRVRSTSSVDNLTLKDIGVLGDVVGANSIWTWFTDQRAIYKSGVYYIGGLHANGSPEVIKYTVATGDYEWFTLHSTLEVDDHDNPAILVLPSGKIACFYSKHNDSSGTRYRISTNVGDISAFDAEQNLLASQSAGSAAYSNVFYLSAADKVCQFYRSGTVGVDASIGFLTANNDLSVWDSEILICEGPTPTSDRPYAKYAQNGNDRIDVLITNRHPDEGASSVYHFYVKWDATSSAFKFYTSDGTEITATTPWKVETEATLVYDGSTISGWVWDIAIDSDGHPRAVFATFPTAASDHRYNFARWTGSAWTTPVEIAAAGGPLYTAQPHYSGGVTFDGNDTDIVYLSVDGTEFEIQEWGTADNGATWSKTTDITTGSSLPNARPFSPLGHEATVGCLFWRANYGSFASFDTASVIKFANDTALDSDTGDLSAAGAATVSFVGRSTATGALTAAGIGALSFVAQGVGDMFTAAGTSTVSFVGSSTAKAAVTMAGLGAAVWRALSSSNAAWITRYRRRRGR